MWLVIWDYSIVNGNWYYIAAVEFGWGGVGVLQDLVHCPKKLLQMAYML